MLTSSLQKRPRRLAAIAAFSFAVWTAHPAVAQTVTDPRQLTFSPSADQAAVVSSDGRPVVDHYDLGFFDQGASQPVQSSSIGKPAPASDGLVHLDLTTLTSWPLIVYGVYL